MLKWWNRWLTDDRPANRAAPLIEELEPRVLLSADAAGIFAPDPAGLQQQTPTELLLDDDLQPAPTQQVAQEEHRNLELVFVDPDSPDYQSIVDSLTGHSSLGGNWVLEARVGKVDTQIFASQGLLQSYRATLAAPVANDDNGDSYSEVVEGISDGYFRLGDAANIADETAGGNDGTAVGGVSTGTGGATGDGDDSLTLNGTDGYVSIPHSADYELNAGAISLWFNSTTIADGDTLFSKDASGTAEGGHLTIRFTGSGAATEIEVRLQNNTATGAAWPVTPV